MTWHTPRRAHPVAVRTAILTLILVSTWSCKKPAAGPPTPQEPTVTVARPIVREVSDWDEYPGRLAAPEMVDVRARVSGFIESAPYNEGAIVKQGDLLFQIDERPFQAELKQRQADQARAEAQLRFATGEFERLDRLHQVGGGSETEYYNARQSKEAAQAAVDAAKAAVEAARLNVEWCRVTAPIAGRTGRKLVTQGNLITGGTASATLLTTITSIDPIYCYFDVDERAVRKYQEMVRQQVRPSARDVRLPCQLQLVDEPTYQHQGYIDFVNNRIDPQTGTITARGVFPNPDHELLPGFFGRIRVPGRGPYRATLVPERAIGANLAQQYVLTVGADDTVQLKPITPGTVVGNLRAVEGIGPDDRVIVNGLASVRPGIKVRAEETQLQWVAATTQSITPATSRPTAGAGAGAGAAGGQAKAVGTGSDQGPAGTGGPVSGQGPSRSNNGPAAAGNGPGGQGGGAGPSGGGGAGTNGATVGGTTGAGAGGAGSGGTR